MYVWSVLDKELDTAVNSAIKPCWDQFSITLPVYVVKYCYSMLVCTIQCCEHQDTAHFTEDKYYHPKHGQTPLSFSAHDLHVHMTVMSMLIDTSCHICTLSEAAWRYCLRALTAPCVVCSPVYITDAACTVQRSPFNIVIYLPTWDMSLQTI